MYNLIGLDEYESEFIELLKDLSHNSIDKNNDWFDPLLRNYKKYLHWSFLLTEDNKFVAFSAIQTFNFPNDCYRVLSRTYYDHKYRNLKNIYDYNEKTPAAYILEDQLSILKQSILKQGFIFCSMEYLQRKSYLKRFAKKLKTLYNQDWTVLENMYLTCSNKESFSCWQNICVKDNDDVPLESITSEEWKDRYGNRRKSLPH